MYDGGGNGYSNLQIFAKFSQSLDKANRRSQFYSVFYSFGISVIKQEAIWILN